MWNASLSDAEIKTSASYLLGTAPSRTPINMLIAEGDSITTGATLNSYWEKYLPNITAGKKVISYNTAAGGNTMANLNLRLPNHVQMVPQDGNRTILSVMVTNGTDDVPAYLSALQTYVTTLETAGIRVAVGTLTPRTNATYNTNRGIINTEIRTWPGRGICTALVDFAADPTVGTDASASDPLLYPDGGHPSDLGLTYLEEVYRPVINGMLL
jgi:hypothetical protein